MSLVTHITAFMVGAALAVIPAYRVSGAMAESELSAIKASYAKQQADMLQSAISQQSLIDERYQHAIGKERERSQAMARERDIARSVLYGLRSDIASRNASLPTATAGSVLEYASTSSELFGECSARYIDLAGKADGHASDARMMLDAWLRQ